MHMSDAHGCCRDEVQVVKMDDDQRPTAAIDLAIPSFEPVVYVPSAFIATSFYNFNEHRSAAFHSPPVFPSQDICVETGVFRI